MVFVSQHGKDKIWEDISQQYSGETKKLVQNVLQGDCDIPGFVRRSDEKPEAVALGFVPQQRIEGNRVRIGAFTDVEDIVIVMSPYDIMQRKVYAHNAKTKCIKTILKLYDLADLFDIKVGVLGSAALELATGLPYTDEASDIDLLVKPSRYEKLRAFYQTAQEKFSDINMDFELELPNGYGVKLAEIFMDTRTVLGKSIDDVNLLHRQDVMQYLI